MHPLLEKIKKVEALLKGATTEGERQAAQFAKDKLQKRIQEIKIPVEFKLYTSDTWHKKLLVAICRKHGVTPYRYYRQKYTTVMVTTDEHTMNQIIWKEYLAIAEVLEELVGDITHDLIKQIHEDESEEALRGELK